MGRENAISLRTMQDIPRLALRNWVSSKTNLVIALCQSQCQSKHVRTSIYNVDQVKYLKQRIYTYHDD